MWLSAGLVETLLEHVKQTNVRLSLTSLKVKQGSKGKDEALLQELTLTFDLLRNLMYKNEDVKVWESFGYILDIAVVASAKPLLKYCFVSSFPTDLKFVSTKMFYWTTLKNINFLKACLWLQKTPLQQKKKVFLNFWIDVGWMWYSCDEMRKTFISV